MTTTRADGIRQARTLAAELFADACDAAHRAGFELYSHGNSGFELKRGERSIAWFFPDRDTSTLLVFTRERIAIALSEEKQPC